MKIRRTLNMEDERSYAQLYHRLQEAYPPRTAQHEADLNTLTRLNWQSERINAVLDTALNQRLDSQILRKINDPALRLCKATHLALSRRQHHLLIKQSEANLRSTNTLVTRVEKWNSSR